MEAATVRIRDCDQGEFLSVRAVQCEAHVSGPLAFTTLHIVFVNDLGRPLEGDLVFPLPAFACLRALEVKCGTRTIAGKIRPRARAQAEYTRAVQAGQTAVLGESEGEDLARIRIAPIDKNEEVNLTLTLYHPLTPLSEGHRLILPLTYMPRFVEDEKALKDIERAAIARPRPLTLQARANVSITVEHPASGAPQVRCSSHATTTTVEGRRTVIKVEAVALDRDLHLDISDRASGEKPSLWIRHDPQEGPDSLGPSTAVAIVPPAYADEGPTTPRTITFLVDRSGSMEGRPMASAIRAVRGCLRALTPDDRFNVVAFDDHLECLARRPLAFDDKSLAAADAFISSIRARGGTEASQAMTAVLDDAQASASHVAVPEAPAPDSRHRIRIVVFMTDGDVGGAEGVLVAAKAKLVDTRLHVLGIGDSVNHAMLATLARLGGGTYAPVSTDEDLERALTRLKNAIDAPLYTGVRVMLESEGDRRTPKNLEPAGPLDLFAGEPLLLAWRGPIKPGDRLILDGQDTRGQDLRMVCELPIDTEKDSASTQAEAALVWAMLKNRRLTYQFNPEDDATLEGLGSSFGLVNRTVALVGVNEERREVEVQGSVAVSLPMPNNIAMAGGFPAPGGAAFFGGAPPPPMACCAPMPTGKPQPRGASSAVGRMLAKARSLIEPAEAPMASSANETAGFGPPPAPGMIPAPSPQIATADSFEMEEARKDAVERKPRGVPDLTDNEAGLRALVLLQGVDGLFSSHVGLTLAAVAALVSRGHTAREGLFRAELRRTLATLKKKVGRLEGEERKWAALAIAMLTMPHGEAAPSDLPAEMAEILGQASLSDLRGLRTAVALTLAQCQGWQAHPVAAETARVFGL